MLLGSRLDQLGNVKDSVHAPSTISKFTDTAILLGQGSVSQESFLPRERQKFAFMESKLEEVAGTSHGNNLYSVRNRGEVGLAGFILLKVHLRGTVEMPGLMILSLHVGAWAEIRHWVS